MFSRRSKPVVKRLIRGWRYNLFVQEPDKFWKNYSNPVELDWAEIELGEWERIKGQS